MGGAPGSASSGNDRCTGIGSNSENTRSHRPHRSGAGDAGEERVREDYVEYELEVMTATLTHDDPGATFGEVTAFLDQFTPITEHTVYVKTSLQTRIVHLRALIK